MQAVSLLLMKYSTIYPCGQFLPKSVTDWSRALSDLKYEPVGLLVCPLLRGPLLLFLLLLLVVAPLTLIGLTFGLSKADKNYLLARKAFVYSSDDDNPVQLYGWRGFFRFPIIFVSATAVVVALAYLLVRFNAFIIYSSPFAVWR